MLITNILKKFNTFKIESPFEIPTEGYLFLYNTQIYDVSKKTCILFSPEGKIIENTEIIDKTLPFYVFDGKDYLICPRFIEHHKHGGFVINFNDCSYDDVIEFAKKIYTYGVGTFFPTIMTDTLSIINKQIKEITKAIDITKNFHSNIAKIGGINLEGPFLSREKAGIHPIELLLPPTIENLNKIDLTNIKLITIAPELDKNFETIKYLNSKNIVVSLGHSSATGDIADAAFQNGATCITHLFNACPPLHHRINTLTTSALLNDTFVEVIGDLNHINANMLKILFKVKDKDKIILVSDALPIAHSKKTSIHFANQEIFSSKDCATNKTGTLAGSTLFLPETFKQLNKTINLSFGNFVKYAISNPSKLLGLDNKLSRKNICFINKKTYEII